VTTRVAAARRVDLRPLLRAAHIGPAVAVTTITALLAMGLELSVGEGVVVTMAVFAGQLTIGWGNDLLDVDRDRAVGRTDKPLANGELTQRSVVRAAAAAAIACLVLSLLAGWRSGLTHLVLLVGSGHLYNVRCKATRSSWLPYAVAFGSLPAVVGLAAGPPRLPPMWMVGTAAALGVAAHLLNALPDLQDDAATGVHGLPHRLGATRSRQLATALLVLGSAFAVLGPPGAPGVGALAAFAVVLALATLALTGAGKVPFHAAILIVLIDVALLTVVMG
jgi:4-hydroxybenzoate polyprenyltransferase